MRRVNEAIARQPSAQGRMTRVLLVDDDEELCELVREYLVQEGFQLDAEVDGARAVERAASGDYQLTVLDVMLPGVSGFDLLRRIRARSRTPVRIRAILRRAAPDGGPGAGDRRPERLSVDDLEVDIGSHVVRRAGVRVELTAVEFSLLEVLLRAPGSVVQRDELTRSVLGRELVPFDRSIDVHVSRLRKKLGPRSDGGERIKAVRAVGYVYGRDDGMDGA
jgi:two-component system response regulator CpxR